MSNARLERTPAASGAASADRILHLLPDLVCQFAPDTTLAYVNDRFCRYFDLDNDQLIGTRLVDYVPSEDADAILARIRVLSRDNPVVSGEHLYIGLGGLPRWQYWTDTGLFDDDGTLTAVIAIGRDVTALRRHQDALEALMDLTHQQGMDLDRTLEGMMAIGSAYLGLDRGIVARVDDGEFVVEHFFTSGDDIEFGTRLTEEQTYCSAVLRAEAPIGDHHVGQGRLRDHPCYAATGMEAYIGAPLLVGGEVYGTVAFAGQDARRMGFGLNEFAFINLLSHWIGVEKARERASQEIESNRKELQFIFDAIPSRIWYKDDRNNIIRINQATADFLGVDKEEAQGRNLVELYPEVADSFFRNDLAVIASNRPVYGRIYRAPDRAGKEEWSRVDKVPYVDRETGGRRILILASDVTPLKEAEEALRKANRELTEQRETFRMLYRRTPAIMHSIDAEGRIVETSDKWHDAFGYLRDEVIGRKSSDFLTPESRKLAQETILPSFFQTGHCDEVPYVFVHKDGKEIEIELSAILEAAGTTGQQRSYAVLNDVTERNRALAALEQKNAALEQANESLRQFAHVASHDIQEPLRKIQTFSTLLSEAVEADNHDDVALAIKVLGDAATRARQLVSDLLVYSRTSNQRIEREPLRLDEVVREAMRDLDLRTAEAKAEITVDVGDACIDADRTQIVQLFTNLISNAVKYHKPGSAPVVRIGIVPGEGSTVESIVIADQGIGFDPRYAGQIFEPFKRLHTRNEFPGTGIGLAICATVARRHGWRIEVASEPDKGSTFRIMPGRDCRIAPAEVAAE